MQDLAGSALFLPQGAHIFNSSPQLPPPPPRGFHGQIFTLDKHNNFVAKALSSNQKYKLFAPGPLKKLKIEVT